MKLSFWFGGINLTSCRQNTEINRLNTLFLVFTLNILTKLISCKGLWSARQFGNQAKINRCF
jgi:hypothetical protein